MQDTSEPQWYQLLEFTVNLPEDDTLLVEVLDHDYFADQLIGYTSIDLAERFFSPTWTELKHKPIEERSLYNHCSRLEQGKIRLFLEIYPKSNRKIPPPVLVAMRPKAEFEIRLIVWSAEDVILEGQNSMDM